MPNLGFRVHANLAPTPGTTAVGKFDGLLSRSGGGPLPVQPRIGSRWLLTWRLSLPATTASATATLHVKGVGGTAPVARVLCARCASSADGTAVLTPGEVLRLAKGDGTVTVRTGTAMLSGTVKVLAHVPVATPGALQTR